MLNDILDTALNKLTKWRVVFTGWQLGTRTKEDPEAQAVRDHREATILLRVEVNALTGLLLKKGVFTHEEFQKHLLMEAQHLDEAYEKRFPGFESSVNGMVVGHAAMATTKGWKP